MALLGRGRSLTGANAGRPMSWLSRIVAGLVLIGLPACATPPARSPARSPAVVAAAPDPAEARAPVTLLVSIDGFRADYLDRGITPNLSALAKGGISAAMRPSFPSKTFPNHWTLVTGLRPDRNGVIGNKMLDPGRPGVTFTMATDDPYWWSGAEPIWVTAEKAGIRTATLFWPGSNVAWGAKPTEGDPAAGGVRPADWLQFNEAIPTEARIATVIDWLRRPAATRPRFLTLYIDIVDAAGHAFGPDSAGVNAAITKADAAIGRLVAGLDELGQPANLVIVADHGMAAIAPDRVVTLDRFSDPADYDVVEEGVYASINPKPGREAEAGAALIGRHGPVECWPRADIPARFAYGRNPRVPAILCLAEVGWSVFVRQPTWDVKGGNHGYDNAAPEMAALFLANGPAIRATGKLPPFDNVDIAPLLRDLLGLPAGQGLDGDDQPFRAALSRRAGP